MNLWQVLLPLRKAHTTHQINETEFIERAIKRKIRCQMHELVRQGLCQRQALKDYIISYIHGDLLQQVPVPKELDLTNFYPSDEAVSAFIQNALRKEQYSVSDLSAIRKIKIRHMTKVQ